MKVMCIDSKPTDGEFPGPMPVEGQVYTVSYQGWGYDTQDRRTPCYALEEIPPCATCDNLFDVYRFIPLSNIDELEIAQSREAVTV